MMTTSESPWKGLSIGGVDARRVDGEGTRDFFWCLSGNGAPALLLKLLPESVEQHPLPKIRSLDIQYRTLANSKALFVVLRDQEQIDLFATLCSDIVAAGEAGKNEKDALDRTIKRTLRWHHLLRGGRSKLLSLEEQRGLLGELYFLRHLERKLGPRAAIEAWKGPEGAVEDFELSQCCVEVKARRGAARPFVKISSEHQLADVDDSELFLLICDVNAAVKPEGKTLTDHVQKIENVFREADQISYSLWENSLAATGFDFEDDYSERRWTVGHVSQFHVREGFPRIDLPVREGVTDIKYSVSIEACKPFEVTENELYLTISKGYAND